MKSRTIFAIVSTILIAITAFMGIRSAQAQVPKHSSSFTTVSGRKVDGIYLINPSHARINLHPSGGPVTSLSDYTTTPDDAHPACGRNAQEWDEDGTNPNLDAFEPGHADGIKCFSDTNTVGAYFRSGGGVWLWTGFGRQNFAGYSMSTWEVPPRTKVCDSQTSGSFVTDDRGPRYWNNGNGDFFEGTLASYKFPNNTTTGCDTFAIFDAQPYGWKESRSESDGEYGHRSILYNDTNAEMWVASVGNYPNRCLDGANETHPIQDSNEVVEVTNYDIDLDKPMNHFCTNAGGPGN